MASANGCARLFLGSDYLLFGHVQDEVQHILHLWRPLLHPQHLYAVLVLHPRRHTSTGCGRLAQLTAAWNVLRTAFVTGSLDVCCFLSHAATAHHSEEYRPDLWSTEGK